MRSVEDAAAAFEQHRGHLFAIAYRMLGSATDAEDVVQEAFLRWLQASENSVVQSPRAYLSTIVVRLCLDLLRSAKARREVYVGPWLPEPIPTGEHADPGDSAVLAESLSFAFLVMLESLGPQERAVFLLRDVFDYDYADIAGMVGKSEGNCRQILRRARQRLGQREARFPVIRQQQARLTEQFVRASASGDLTGLLSLLADDVVFVADGGGKARAGIRPVHGPEKVARGMLGGLRALATELEARVIEINGQPAIVGYTGGRPYGVVILDVVNNRIQRVFLVANPDKLGWFVPIQGTD
ncbi:MAG TPA: RNA polymerase sigma-70 factor [Chloroflexota bacterium]|nr:RNA polymerase sigma-70 factor [Chloroflexota bacterium]